MLSLPEASVRVVLADLGVPKSEGPWSVEPAFAERLLGDGDVRVVSCPQLMIEPDRTGTVFVGETFRLPDGPGDLDFTSDEAMSRIASGVFLPSVARPVLPWEAGEPCVDLNRTFGLADFPSGGDHADVPEAGARIGHTQGL